MSLLDIGIAAPIARAVASALDRGNVANTVYKQASIVSVQAGTPPTVTINLAGVVVPGVPFYNGYAPTGGDVVDVLFVDGVIPLVLGAPSYRAPGYATEADFTALQTEVHLAVGRITGMGYAVLGSTGVVDVHTAAYTSTCRLFLSNEAASGPITDIGTPHCTGGTAGVVFTIRSTNTADRSRIAWMTVEPT